MNKTISFSRIIIALLVVLTSCSKEELLTTTDPTPPVKDTAAGTPPVVPGPVNRHITANLRAIVKVGAVRYDSIAAELQVTSWDSSGNAFHNILRLAPGRNAIQLAEKFPRHKFTMKAWNTEKSVEMTREEVVAAGVIELETARAAKKLRSESSFILIQGTDQQQSKTDYYYHDNGNLRKIDFYQKKPEVWELQLTWIDHFSYTGNKVKNIRRTNGAGQDAIQTSFSYHAAGFLEHIHQSGFGNETYAYIAGPVNAENGEVTIDYLFSNGQAMTYNMTFRNGNKVEETATGSTGAGEGGEFTYDQNVNPYNQMNWPDLYLRNLSKNNRTLENKGYTGSIPSVIPYRTVFTYDEDGYPVQMIKSYKNPINNDHLYDIKTLYFY